MMLEIYMKSHGKTSYMIRELFRLHNTKLYTLKAISTSEFIAQNYHLCMKSLPHKVYGSQNGARFELHFLQPLASILRLNIA